MSRSKWACVESCRRVSVVAFGVVDRASLKDRGRFGRAPLTGAVSSTKRLVGLMSASMLVMAAAPSSALAGSASRSHPTPSCTNHTKTSLVHVAGAAVLAFGSGYSSRRDAVRELQRRLTRAGYVPGLIDGRYGPRTEQAVTRFQAAHGLVVDGIAGPCTLAALRSTSAVLYPGTGYARQGSGAVRALQGRLIRAGYVPGPIDGRYGPRTEQAVARFQAAHGLLVDGIAGPQTLARLGGVRRPHKPSRPLRPKNSRQRANRPGHSHPRRNTAPRKVVSPTRSTRSPSLAPVVVLVGLVVGLWATWRAYRRRNRQSAGVDAQTKRANAPALDAQTKRADAPGQAAALPTNPSQTASPNQPTTPRSRDLTRPESAERLFSHALLLEEQGDLAAALAVYSRADQLGHGAAACNLGVLLHARGDRTAAEMCFRRADERGDPHGAFNLALSLEAEGHEIEALRAYQRAAQVGDPETAELARTAADQLRQRIERATAARKGGGAHGS